MKLDVSTFETLFKVNYSALCLTAIRIIGDKDIAEDISFRKLPVNIIAWRIGSTLLFDVRVPASISF